MIVLGLETATPMCGIGVVADDRVIAEYRIHRPHVHAELLTPALARTLADAGLSLADVQGIAVSEGPGSYTGLRVGYSVGKGLAMALGIPLTTVPTLECLAWQARPLAAHLCAAIPAIRGRLYWATFRRGRGGVRPVRRVRRLEMAQAAATVTPESTIVGPLNEAQRHALQAAGVAPQRFAVGAVNCPSPLVVAELGARRLTAGVAPWAGLEPLYVGDFPDRA